MKLSIIIPVYNLENYIEDCLNSIIPQLTKEIEVIIVDDGSTDNSAEIIKSFLNNQIKYFYQKNKKQGAARNTGLKKAKGKYIWFIDGDDIIKDNAIKTIFKYEITHLENHDLMLFGINTVNNNKNSLKIQFPNKNNQNISDFLKSTNIYSISPCNKIINKRFLLKNKLFFEENMFFEDNLFFLKLYNHTNYISSISENLYIQQIREGSTMRSSYDIFKLNSQFKILEEIKKIKPIKLKKQFIENKLFWYTHIYLRKCFLFEENIQKNKIQKCYKLIPKFKIYLTDPFGVIKLKLLYNFNKKYFLKSIM